MRKLCRSLRIVVKKRWQSNYIVLGIFVFAIGIFKKVGIADVLSPVVREGFDVQQSLTFVEAWLSSLAFTFQLYFDFSGYSDMAIGIALMFNIKLPQNFNSPYKAVSIQDFWHRWHMTLSQFLTKYVYISLGGNRKGITRTYVNIMIVFLISGLWHGAGWTFIFWGISARISFCRSSFVEQSRRVHAGLGGMARDVFLH